MYYECDNELVIVDRILFNELLCCNGIELYCIMMCCVSQEGEISEELMNMRNVISIGFMTIDYEKCDIDWLYDHRL